MVPSMRTHLSLLAVRGIVDVNVLPLLIAQSARALVGGGGMSDAASVDSDRFRSTRVLTCYAPELRVAEA